MRVVLASNHGADRSYGGAERYVDDLAGALRQRATTYVLLSAFPIRDESAAETTTLHPTDWRDDRLRRYRNHADDWVAAPWPALGRVLADLRPDLLHTSNLPGISTGLWEQARRLGIPVVHTLHDYHLLCPRTSLTRRDGTACRPSPALCGLRTRRLARWAGAVQVAIGVSAHVLGRHEGFFPASTERRVVRPPIVPIPPVGSAGESRPLSPPATIGYLGALSESKGVRLLLQAAPALAAAGFTLAIAGDGPLRSEVQASAAVRYEGRSKPVISAGSCADATSA